ncbi:hypothetical protein [Roseovarius nitratireducens]|uniref:hypothetical protein n=1 Tax=Roseovarius nitratireducens TaxID=2044597 RepID=UPI00197FDDC3|nr:hypothetical protein [Roseovarius nitratireducens]
MFIAALGLIFSVSLGYAQEIGSQPASENQPRQEKRTANSQGGSEGEYYDTIDLTPALEGIEAAIRDLIAEEDKIEAKRREDNEQRDLNAQEQMAKWAKWMTLVTIGGVIATVVGLFLIYRTLQYTRKAADDTGKMLVEAKRSAEAAEEAVAATRDIGEKQVRAYLHIKDVSVFVSRGLERGLGVEITVANAGQSPCIDCEAVIHFTMAKQGSAVIHIPIPDIAANSEKTGKVRAQSVSETSDWDGDAVRITAIGKVFGYDVFNNEIFAQTHRTRGFRDPLKSGERYALEDAGGYFPSAAIAVLAEQFEVKRRMGRKSDGR